MVTTQIRKLIEKAITQTAEILFCSSVQCISLGYLSLKTFHSAWMLVLDTIDTYSMSSEPRWTLCSDSINKKKTWLQERLLRILTYSRGDVEDLSTVHLLDIIEETFPRISRGGFTKYYWQSPRYGTLGKLFMDMLYPYKHLVSGPPTTGPKTTCVPISGTDFLVTPSPLDNGFD